MPKNMTLRIEFARENPTSRGYFYSYLDLPAEEHEIRDALQKARCTLDKDALYDISITESPYLYALTDRRLDSPTIDEVNFFAKRLEQMDDSERAIFRVIAPKVLGSHADDILSMKDLINCTYGYDEIMVASNIHTDEQLGRFIIENKLHDDVNNIPESSQYLLDKAKIGMLFRESLNCTLSNGYAVFTSDYKLPEIYNGKQLPETKVEDRFAFRLQIAPPPVKEVSEVENDAVWLTLPMERNAADRIAHKLGVDSIEECVYLDFESSFPQIAAEQFGDMQLFDKLNSLAEQLLYLSPTDQMKFKAALTAESPADLDGVRDILDNLRQYELNANVDDDGDFFKDYLEHHLGTGFDRQWFGTLLTRNEGTRLLERLGATNTDYGVISARGGSLYTLVPYNKLDAAELKTQRLTDEKLEVVEVLGQTALFSNGRVTEQELPKGLYKYELSEGESLSFSSIELNVGVNFGGTIITKAPLDCGSQEYFVFSEDTTPNFLGYDLTPKEFMETDFTQTEEEDQTEDEDEAVRMGGMQI